MRWELTITDEAGNVAMVEKSAALYGSPRPGDGLLVAMDMTPGDWKSGENGSFSAPLNVAEGSKAERKLITGLLARGRSDPRGRAGEDESSLRPGAKEATGG